MNKQLLDILTAIAAIATIIATLLAFLKVIGEIGKRKKIEKLKREIKEKTDAIVQSFRPNNIIIDASSTKDLQLIKDFQIAVLESIMHWNSISTMESISNFNILNASQLLSAKSDQLNTINKFEGEINKAIKILKDISDYGRTNNINYYLPKQDKLAALGTKQFNRMVATAKINQDVTGNILRLLKKYPSGPIPRKKIIKAVKLLDKYNTMDTTLAYLNDFYSFCAENNAAFMQYFTVH